MTRLARTTDGAALLGDDSGFVPLRSALPACSTTADALALAASGDLPSVDETPSTPIVEDDVRFSTPLDAFGKLWGIGLNYADHAADLNEERPTQPASFMKPSTAVTGPVGPIRLPPRELTDRVTAEAELGVVIGRECRNVSVDDADDVVAGYVPIIDMTAEDILEQNPRYLTRSKSFDSFIVVGPWLRTTDEVDSLDDVTVKTVVNDDVVAENTVANMMTRPNELVSFHSEVMTLQPGDVISTGTPGAHVIAPGDSVRAEVDHVGTLSADVVQGR
ncbi:2-keto-4-pentenoate hydratase/2-oxohepta-3-ene-1,7-dioic acid hydratase (catechol pathway) [Halogranum rubrum]|uniref:2-keto-4-pentenoate hydratase/2-oxohepta-3-ene-1,7-dioic acid hydratase (Catechol pathway) n=1 Tax=Halogranum rubrum TaxID=553466 RepID=A0A1I4E5V9_9EURY|nr:fumarylacetoacetate hydrolase family protein [Halogranum rubrum]SFK99746.1 2-keto-4-pentenoate hydratase/2-oxohepta-3-ene-1,7-dioic acid hydratase (catechol pathway) [Halogranum rubrum]